MNAYLIGIGCLGNFDQFDNLLSLHRPSMLFRCRKAEHPWRNSLEQTGISFGIRCSREQPLWNNVEHLGRLARTTILVGEN